MALKLNRKNIIWTILILSILIKFIHIDLPLLEGSVGRQLSTAMTTRNIFRGENIFLPKIDEGPFPHYVMLEFPIFNIIVAALYKIFGMHDVLGRLVSILSIIVATVFLFRLVRRFFSYDVAFLSAIFFNLSPISIIYSRSYQPDPMMICLIVCGLYLLNEWVDNSKKKYLIVSALLFSVAFLIKIVALYIFLPVLFLFWLRHKKKLLLNPDIWIFVAISVLPSVPWYIHARNIALSPQFATVTSVWHISKSWLVFSCWTDPSSYKTFFKIFFGRLLTPVGTALFFIGLLRRNKNGRQLFFYIYMAALLVFSFLLLKKADIEYYYLAYLPVISVFMARGLEPFLTDAYFKKEFYTKGVVVACLAVLSVVLILGYSVEGFKVPYYLKDAKEAALAVKKATSEKDLVIAQSPVLYYADRKGYVFYYIPEDKKVFENIWNVKLGTDYQKEEIDCLVKNGAAFFADTLAEKEDRYPAFFEYMKKRFGVCNQKDGKYIILKVSRQ